MIDNEFMIYFEKLIILYKTLFIRKNKKIK